VAEEVDGNPGQGVRVSQGVVGTWDSIKGAHTPQYVTLHSLEYIHFLEVLGIGTTGREVGALKLVLPPILQHATP
jgi:hypothetical protein